MDINTKINITYKILNKINSEHFKHIKQHINILIINIIKYIDINLKLLYGNYKSKTVICQLYI